VDYGNNGAIYNWHSHATDVKLFYTPLYIICNEMRIYRTVPNTQIK